MSCDGHGLTHFCEICDPQSLCKSAVAALGDVEHWCTACNNNYYPTRDNCFASHGQAVEHIVSVNGMNTFGESQSVEARWRGDTSPLLFRVGTFGEYEVTDQESKEEIGQLAAALTWIQKHAVEKR